MLLQQLGAGRSYARKRRRAVQRFTDREVYNPPRITKEMREGRWKLLVRGFALDVTVVDPSDGLPWDFSRKSKRDRAIALVRQQKPYMLIGLPACEAFSMWQVLNRARTRDAAAMDRALAAATRHLDFGVSLYQEQIDGGRYFLHEQPLHESSWSVPSIEKLWQMPNVLRAHGDQCICGAEARSGESVAMPVKEANGVPYELSVCRRDAEQALSGRRRVVLATARRTPRTVLR